MTHARRHRCSLILCAGLIVAAVPETRTQGTAVVATSNPIYADYVAFYQDPAQTIFVVQKWRSVRTSYASWPWEIQCFD